MDEEDDVVGACDAHTWEPVLLFDRDSMDFVLGFEAGMLYAEAKAILALDLLTPHERLIHTANAEMAIRIAESNGLVFRAEDTEDEDWITFIMDVED